MTSNGSATTGSLTGKTALVTGGSRNLGAVLATELARHGARVALTYHSSRDAAASLVEELRSETGVDHVAVRGDATRVEGVVGMVDGGIEVLGRPIDVLVNNAGPYLATPLIELDPADWRRTIDANLKATYLATQRVVPGMRQSGWGRIVNVSAVSSWVRDRSVYGLAKHAVNKLTEQLALELGPGITVNAVAPGQIEESLDDLEEVAPEWARQVVTATPLGRLVTREQIARAVVLLCGPTFDAVTGAVIPLDGGLRLNRLG